MYALYSPQFLLPYSPGGYPLQLGCILWLLNKENSPLSNWSHVLLIALSIWLVAYCILRKLWTGLVLPWLKIFYKSHLHHLFLLDLILLLLFLCHNSPLLHIPIVEATFLFSYGLFCEQFGVILSGAIFTITETYSSFKASVASQ